MHLPGPLRAAVGLAATAADELKSLPDRAIELPMVAVSSALQLSLRAQQRYAQLSARGEQVLNGQTPTEQPPAWATFDEPATPDQLRRAALNQLDSLVDSDMDAAGDGSDATDAAAARDDSAGRHPSSQLFEELFGVSDPAAASPDVERDAPADSDADSDAERATVTPIGRAAGRSAAAKKTARKTAVKRAPAKKSPAKTAAKKVAVKAAVKRAPDTADKQVSKPRDRAPSKFDDAD